MARNGKAKRQEMKEVRFSRLKAAATEKFESFKALNKDLDAKTNTGMTQAEKLQVAARRAMASNIKRGRVARETHALVENPGTGSCKGFWNDGKTPSPVRGKEKVKKTPSQPHVKFRGE